MTYNHEQRAKNMNNQVLQNSPFDDLGSTATNVGDGFTMLAVGDLIVSRRLAEEQHPGLTDIVKLIRQSDVAFGNLETNIFDIRTFAGGSPLSEYTGGAISSLLEVAPDLNSIGFNIVSRANNHTFDWGLEGMRETGRMLDRHGIVHAGVGENLAHAGAPRFLETPRGRAALVSFASTFTPWSRAGDPAGEAPGRPGLNSLRLKRNVVVRPDMLECVRRIREALPNPKLDIADVNAAVLAGVTFKSGDSVRYTYEPHSSDAARILRNVRQGKQFSDFVIATNHDHSPGNWSEEPPDYARSFAYKLIDAGADAHVIHGPHRLRGIEIYKNRPIFYSLGNFIFDSLQTPLGADMFAAYGKDAMVDTEADLQGATIRDFADPAFYESVVAISKFQQNQLVELLLYPVELGFSKRLANRGVPCLAPPTQARNILERLQKLSRPFGTQISIEDNIGLIRLKPVTGL